MSEFPVGLVLCGVGSTLAFSSMFYHLYQEKTKELKKIKEIPVFRPDQHLLQVLKASPQRKLQYVAVEGLVQADAEPLLSHFVPRLFGVVQKITVEEHWQKWNCISRTWNSRRTNRKETNNCVAFSLVNPGVYFTDLHVKVQDPLDASGCFLERVHHRVRNAEKGVLNVVVQGLSNEKPMAKEETEEMLKVGSPLIGFGEVVLEEGGQVMRLRAPQDRRKFILVPSDYRSFMDRHQNTAIMWKTLSAVTGITGTTLLAAVVYNSVKGKRDNGSR